MQELQPLRTLDLDRSTHTTGQRFLSAASGLVCAFGRVYVVGDDEHHLAVFDDAARATFWRWARVPDPTVVVPRGFCWAATANRGMRCR